MNFSSAIESVGKGYEPKEGVNIMFQLSNFCPFSVLANNFVVTFVMQLTDFKKLFDDEIERQKARTSIVPEKDPLFRQFTAAIWVWFVTTL